MEKESQYPVAKWAKALNVSTSGYYDWIKRKEQKESAENEYKSRVKTAFNESDGTYGVDRICAVIRKDGHTASAGKVKRIMNELGLKSIHERKRQRSLTNSKKSRGEGYPNLVKGLEITKPYEALTSDISYIKTDEGFSYICTVRDILSNIVIGYHVEERMTKDLVIKAFLNAEATGVIKEGTIFHSDRGSQYTSIAFKEILKSYGIKQSFSRVGMPGDNAWSESFFSIMKKESVHWRHFRTREEVKQEMFLYIECFYNRRRIQKRLGYISPLEYVKAWEINTQKKVA